MKMGQAFDDKGNVLGEAFGETKREVFDKLNEQFKEAHEIRIRRIREESSGDPTPAPEPQSEPPQTPVP